jgi:hypothetical protein
MSKLWTLLHGDVNFHFTNNVEVLNVCCLLNASTQNLMLVVHMSKICLCNASTKNLMWIVDMNVHLLWCLL